jgi:hypothetical protein
MYSKRALHLGVALGLSLAAIGTIILALYSSPVDKSEVTIDKSLTVKANEYKEQFFGYYSAYDNVVSFTVLNGTIYTCEPLFEGQYLEWQADRYTPNLTETNQGSYQYEGTHVQYPMLGAIYTRYLFFFNQDSYDKEIQWRITAKWQETNTTNLTIGAALMTAGLGTALALALAYQIKANPHQTPVLSMVCRLLSRLPFLSVLQAFSCQCFLTWGFLCDALSCHFPQTNLSHLYSNL